MRIYDIIITLIHHFNEAYSCGDSNNTTNGTDNSILRVIWITFWIHKFKDFVIKFIINIRGAVP